MITKSILIGLTAVIAGLSPVGASAAEGDGPGATSVDAAATVADGSTAVALAVEVGRRSPMLAAAVRTRLAAIGNGQAEGAGRIVVAATNVQCRASNVVINQWSCSLTFGTRTVEITGMAAHELIATLGEAGVPSDGAAGSTYTQIGNLSCNVAPRLIRDQSANGAHCAWTPDAG